MEDSNSIVLRTDRESLAAFITSLLKQPRRIEDNIEHETFLIELNWIENLIDICDQRLSQNPHSLVSFQCSIQFADGHRDILYDINSLRSFHSNRPCLTTGFDLLLTYLVDFPGSEEPQKQDIRTMVRSSFDSPRLDSRGKPLIHTTVLFTNLTWGEDVARHLSAHVRSSIKGTKIAAVTRFLSKYDKIISVLTLLLSMMLMTQFMPFIFAGDSSNTEHLQKLLSLPDLSMGAITNKIDGLIMSELVREKSHPPASLPLIMVPLMALFFLPEMLVWLLQSVSKSFVVLNAHTKSAYDAYLDRRTRIKWVLIGACVTIPLGLVVTALAKLHH